MSDSMNYAQLKFVALVRDFSQLTGKNIPVNRGGHGAQHLGDAGMRDLADVVEGLRSFQTRHPGFSEIPNDSIPINSVAHGLEIVNQIDNHNLSPEYAHMDKDELHAAIDSFMHASAGMELVPKRDAFVDQNGRQVSIDYGIRFDHGNMTLSVSSNLLEGGKIVQSRAYADADLPEDLKPADLENKVFAEFKFVPTGKPAEIVEPLMAAARSSQWCDVLAAPQVMPRAAGHTPVIAKLDALLQSMGAFTPENRGIDQTLTRFTLAPMASMSLAITR